MNHIQQGTGNRERGTGLKVSWYMALFLKFVPHLPEICCIYIQMNLNIFISCTNPISRLRIYSQVGYGGFCYGASLSLIYAFILLAVDSCSFKGKGSPVASAISLDGFCRSALLKYCPSRMGDITFIW